MDFDDILTSDLPAPRDDEPESLRDDILDELADHLACAYRREVMRGADAQTAKERVLQRFGNPPALARRLWFDAMKGRIMKQRVLIIYSIVLTLLFVGQAGMMYIQSVAGQRAAREALAMAEMERARAAAAQQEMLEKLDAISKAAESPKMPDWIPVTFKLTEETPDGPPALGFHASLGKGENGANQPGAIHRESDDKGMIDFGVVQPGDWGYTLARVSDNGRCTWQGNGTLNVLPGTTITKTVVCPATKRVPIAVDVEWPSDLANQGLVVLATLGHQGQTYQPPLHWWCVGNWPLLVRSDGRPIEIESNQFYSWASGGEVIASKGGQELKGGKFYVDFPGIEQKGADFPPGSYVLHELRAMRPLKERPANFRGARYGLLAFCAPPFPYRQSGMQVPVFPQPPTDDVNPNSGLGSFMVVNMSPFAASNSYWRQAPTFEARKDQPNHWTIHLPDELIKAVREKLKDEKKK